MSRHHTAAQIIEFRRKQKVTKMQPTTPVVPASAKYLAAVGRRDVLENIFHPQRRSDKRVREENSWLRREVSALRFQTKQQEYIIAELEKTVPLKRSLELDKEPLIGYVISPTKVDSSRKGDNPIKT
jgi:hypothetical protein